MIANENEIMGDLKTQINDAWNDGILDGVLHDQKATTTDTTEGAYANTIVRTASECACQYFFYQLMEKDPERFALKGEGSTGLLEPTNGIASLPFKVDDAISFPLTVKTHPDQRSYIDGSTIANHKYKIKLVLTV
jgi:hypothetical protein